MNPIKTLLMAVMLLVGITAYGQYNPGNPAEPGAYHKLTLRCVPEGAGSFNINDVTVQGEGIGVNLRAYTGTGYRFVRWESSDGKSVSTASSFNYTIPGRDVTLVARFEKYYNPGSPSEPQEPSLPRYTTLDVKVSKPEAGSVNVSSSNRYEIGSSVRLVASANKYYIFENWTQDGKVISTSSSFNYVVKETNPTITANFRHNYSPGNPDEPGKPTFRRRLFLTCEPNGAGYFNISSGNEYTDGSKVQLIAYANKDYRFRNWTIDGEVISDSYSFYFTMPETDAQLVANYDYVWEYRPGNPDEPTSPSTQDFNIYGMMESIYPGQTINYPVYLRNNQEVTGLVIDIKIPDGFTADLEGIILSSRCNGHEIAYEATEDGYIRFTVADGGAFASDNGKIFDIPLTASQNVEADREYTVLLKHGVVILPDGSNMPVYSRDGALKTEFAADGTLYARFSYDKFQNRVKFHSQSSENATACEWDFGDGYKSIDESPVHVYANPGTYVVRLTVTGDGKSASYEQNVLINDRSTWTASGNFYLGDGDLSVRYFHTFGELLSMLDNSRIDGDIIVNVESGKEFSLGMGDSDIAALRRLGDQFGRGDCIWIFQKDGSTSNPVVSYGNSIPSTFNPEVIELMTSLGRHQRYHDVEVKLWTLSFDPSQIERIADQNICTGIRTEPVDFSGISTDLTFEWKLTDGEIEGLSGLVKSGSSSIPSMSVINEGYGDANLEYTVTATFNGKVFTTFPVRMTVHPALVGLFTEMFPKDGSRFDNNNVTVTWNNIDNATYDLYLWKTGGEKPEDPTVSSTSSLRANVSRYCSNGNRYFWQVRARNSCQEIYSDTLSFQIGSLPDLHVSRLEVSDAVAGKEMTVSWTVVNDGNGDTGDVQWSDNVWLVPDVYVGTSSVYLETQRIHPKLLKTVGNIKSLKSGESYDNSIKIELEERIYGDFWIIVASDMHDVKNIRWQTVNNAVPNPYQPSATGSPYPYLYASTTSSYNKLSEAGESTTSSDNFNYRKIKIEVPGLVDLAVKSVVAEVDNEPGTRLTNMGRIRIEPTPHTTCGLAESKEFYSGKHLKVTATIKNDGGLKLESTSFTCVLYVSHSPERDGNSELIPLTSENVYTFLDPGSTTNVTFRCQIPYEWYGDTYFHVFADVNDNVYELSSKQNNWGESDNYVFKITPRPDFLPSELKVPETITSETPFAISYKVDNVGPNVPFKSVWTDAIYLSRKEVFDDSAMLIGQTRRQGRFSYTVLGDPGGPVLIPASEYKYEGDSYTSDLNLSVKKVEDADYYIYVKVDQTDLVMEDDPDGENNNVIRSSVISCRKPDLCVDLVSVDPDTITAGGKVALTWKIRNVGRGTVREKMLTDKLYASRNQDGANPILIATLNNEIFINPGDEQTLRANITVPEDKSLDGLLYIFMNTNADTDNIIEESARGNNRSEIVPQWFRYDIEEEKPVVVKGTNIGIADLSIPASGKPGETVKIIYSLTNTGNKKVDVEIPQEVFFSRKENFSLSEAVRCEVVAQQGSSVNLGAEDATTMTLTVKVPSDIKGGEGYLHVFADRLNSIKEQYTKDNYDNGKFLIAGHLPVLEISDLEIPETVKTSEDFDITWTVTNTGDWVADPFTMGVYASFNGKGSSNADLLTPKAVGVLEPGESVKGKATISIADWKHGKTNFFVTADCYNKIIQAAYDKNTASKTVNIELSPIPDLCVTSLKADGTAWSGQKITLVSKFANKGEHRTRVDRWSEEYYLAQSNILNVKNATKIGSRVHIGALDPGKEYTSTMSVNIPPDIEGNYMIFSVIDGGNAVYESDENNNSRSIPIFVNGRNICATDLVVSGISAPAKINAGEEFTIEYRISNQGEFKASGACRDVIYLSTDNTYDIEDPMVGTVSGSIEIMPGGSITRKASGRITNMPEGNYYLIVKTNSTRSIAETDNDNNAGIMPSPVSMVFPVVELDGSVGFNTSGLYKLSIPAGSEGKTMGIYLGHSEEDTGALYVSYGTVPTTAAYEECSARPRTDRQEVIISDVKQGNYYILAQDNASVVSYDNFAFSFSGSQKPKRVPLTLSAKELRFGASSLSISQGGNGGWISTGIKGAMLDSIMDFRLVGKGTMIPVENLHFKNSTSTVATFNLNNAELGQYDVVSELPDGTQATLANGFSVVPATSVNVEVKLDGPSTFRLNSYAPMTLAYFNNGTNDVELYELMLTIDDGYISATYDGLDRDRQKVLHFRPDFERNSRGFISLPPGERCVFTFFIKTGGIMENNVSVYVVK